MKTITTILVSLFFTIHAIANNVEISDVFKSGTSVSFDVTWDNSWRTVSDDHDAVWIFLKLAPNGGPSWKHVRIKTTFPASGFEAEIDPDETGFILRRSIAGNGSVSTNVTVHLYYSEATEGVYQDVKVTGLEMVKVDSGSFYLGDGASDRTFHRGDDETASYHVQSEGVMTHGNTENDFDGGTSSVDIPANFPKGYAEFYCMKYQITQGQYVDFLNSIPRAAQNLRTNTDLSGTSITNRYVMTNTSAMTYSNAIRCDATISTGNIFFYCDHDGDGIGNESNDGQSKVCGFLTVQDVYAYLDWAGLGIMTNLEYEKACRGSLAAVPLEYAWGSNLINHVGSILNDGEANEKHSNSGVEGGLIPLSNSANVIYKARRVGLNAPASGATRELSNASFYGIMDMTSRFDNLCVNYKSDQPYEGEEGDGELTITGDADFLDITITLQLKRYAESTNDDRGRVSSLNANYLLTNRISTATSRGVKRM